MLPGAPAEMVGQCLGDEALAIVCHHHRIHAADRRVDLLDGLRYLRVVQFRLALPIHPDYLLVARNDAGLRDRGERRVALHGARVDTGAGQQIQQPVARRVLSRQPHDGNVPGEFL